MVFQLVNHQANQADTHHVNLLLNQLANLHLNPHDNPLPDRLHNQLVSLLTISHQCMSTFLPW
jgi:hypothetical protein